ncbi:MAG: tetratricopeptide repeat protein, partial [Deltaproteobacteria bacterium]|nr:tetratricopeptide repeat protein [Deltaproteobacteria bacterium]
MTARKRNPFLLALILLVLVAPAGSGSLAQDEAQETAGAPTVQEMGMMLEQARRLPSDQIHPRLLELTEPMLRVLNSDLDDRRRAAASWLAAELMDELGRHASSQERWSEAEDAYGKGLFADDLEFAQIRALEMNGRDAEAAKRWEKWEKRHGGSSLFSEVRLARVWNALRRGANEEAAKRLDSIPEQFQWMRDDPRYRVAQATLAYVQGDDALALQILETKPVPGASATYLRALAHDRQGATLKAAALYQEVIERYGDSPLRDFAMLAKANTFLEADAHRSAAEEFDRAAQLAGGDEVRAESALRHAASILMDDDVDAATTKLREVVDQFSGSSVAARAQFLLGETLFERGLYEDAIVEYNRVLRDYFEHQVAASAQYRVGRCHDALGRRPEAVGAYEAVVRGYPLEPESPVAAYLAGVDLLEMDRPHDAVPYFQLVLDRYGASRPSTEQASDEREAGIMVFASDEQREVVEAALCLLQFSWYLVGDLGQLSGAPHLLLQRMPPSRSPWRVYALLIDADALAAQGRYTEAQNSLNMLLEQFPEHPAGRPAMQLLAWTYAQEGRDDLALAMDQKLLQRYGED